jgi:putative hydrolase of the HAD superfamily
MTKKIELEAVAFDLDGTLYPNYRFYARIIPFIIKEYRLLLAFGKARVKLRAAKAGDGLFEREFYEAQAFLMARSLDPSQKTERGVIQRKVEELIYRGWEPLFKKVKLFSHARETLAELKQRGLKLGLLSDFPLERKLEYMGLSGLWDTALCSETIGRLKPDPKPFLTLAQNLGVSPNRILYVGNSERYDIEGAKNVGMHTALKTPFLKNILKKYTGGSSADFVFYDYRALRDYVL